MCYYCPCFTQDKTDIQKSYINYPSHMEDMTVPGSEINWFWFREQCLNRLSRKQALFMNTYFTGLSLIRYWWVIGSCDELGKQTIKGTGWIWLSQVVVVFPTPLGLQHCILQYLMLWSLYFLKSPFTTFHMTLFRGGGGSALRWSKRYHRRDVQAVSLWWFVGTSVICSIYLPRALSSQWLIHSLFPWIYLQRKRF